MNNSSLQHQLICLVSLLPMLAFAQSKAECETPSNIIEARTCAQKNFEGKDRQLNVVYQQALYCNIKRVPEPAATPPTLAEATLWIARLGGFLARNGDGNPGSNVLWRSFQHLPHITDMFLIMRRNE